MRIAHIFSTYPNPYQPYNEQLIKRMQAAGFVCFTFSLFGKGRPQQGCIDKQSRKYKLHYVLRSLGSARKAWAYRKQYHLPMMASAIAFGRFSYLTDKSPDLIHVHHVQSLSKELLQFLEFIKIPWVISLRGYEIAIRPLLSEEDHQLIRERLLAADGVHVVAEDLKRRALAMGATDERIQVIRRTVEVEQLISPQVDYKDEVIHLTTIGRFNWKKGFVFLLQCVPRLKEMGINVVVHICGSGNTDQEAEIRYWIWLLQIENNVVMHGFLSSQALDEVLRHTHVYVQPSVNEGIPNTLLRVMANHIPVVASSVDGIPEVVDHEINGLLVPAGDVAALAEAIARIIKDEALRDNIRKAPLRNMALDPAKEMSDYATFYTRIIKAKTSRKG